MLLPNNSLLKLCAIKLLKFACISTFWPTFFLANGFPGRLKQVFSGLFPTTGSYFKLFGSADPTVHSFFFFNYVNFCELCTFELLHLPLDMLF